MSEDQARLSAERARQEEKKAAKNAPAQMPETADFAYKFAEGMGRRSRRSASAAAAATPSCSASSTSAT